MDATGNIAKVNAVARGKDEYVLMAPICGLSEKAYAMCLAPADGMCRHGTFLCSEWYMESF